MRISQTFASRYFKASDLSGEEMLATISHVAEEEVGQDRQPKPVLYLNGQQKGIVLNRTNAERLAAKLGDDTKDWKGAHVELYSEPVNFEGRKMDGLRLRVRKSNDAVPF
jgi:hypothetical protein